MNTKPIIVMGSKGMVGSAIVRRLRNIGYENVHEWHRGVVDLADENAVFRGLKEVGEEASVILCAAKVGGIKANNDHPVEFLYNNLKIEMNVVSASYAAGIKSLCFLGSSCVYPKTIGSHRMLEPDDLLSAPLEPTNQWYAIAKIAGIKLCEAFSISDSDIDYFSVMPCNLYGPCDRYDLESSHVIPALIRKFHEAKRDKQEAVEVWGDGTPLREFMHVDDAASGIVRLLEIGKQRGGNVINLGSNRDCTIDELAKTIKAVVGFKGDIVYVGPSAMNGVHRKLMKTLSIDGWEPKFSNLKAGIKDTYSAYLETLKDE